MAVLVACALRLNNALRYPPDWGFDASFNWSYIVRLGRDWSLPDPEGYSAFAWRNPSYVVLKGSSLLALALPFSYYASEALTRWGRRSRSLAAGLLVAGVALAACVVVGASFGVFFTRDAVPGLPWQEVPLR